MTGPLQVFSDANELLGRDAYNTTLASLYGGPVTTDTGVALNTRRLAGVGLDTSDTLIACGGDGVYAASRDNRLVAGIQRAAEKCGRVASTCTGAFLLGAAGLLDGRRAVTHWQRCSDLARIYTEETGMTPARAVEQMRVEAARAMLENPGVSIKTIAMRTGFGNDERMRRSFARQLGITPQAYRDRFAVEVVDSVAG